MEGGGRFGRYDVRPATSDPSESTASHDHGSVATDDMAEERRRNARIVHEQAETIAHYKKMFDRASALAKIGVWECDLATEELTWTDGVYDLFELPRGSPVERGKAVLFYYEDSLREMERLRADAIRTGGSFNLDIRVRTAKGNDRWIRLTADVEVEDGKSVRIFGSKQDITQEKLDQEKVQSLQTELVHVSRRSAMGVMVATLAHELNQPLTAISNYAAGTRRVLANPETGRDVLERGLEAIEENAIRAGNIIRSLREMNKGSEGRKRSLNPSALIREAALLALTDVGEGVSLTFDLADDPLILVDPVQIQQVLINLIKNASEAVQDCPRREIAVSTSLVDDAFAIGVDDTGPGIPAEMFKALFETVVSSKRKGMGVGLSISRTIIEAHGGKISAANRKSGGASFRIVLPLAPNI
jgi:two-component system sensor kinase FixL